MHFELSLPLLWLVIFALVSFVNLVLLSRDSKLAKSPRTKLGLNFPGISDRKFFLFALFPLYVTLSILWSPNPTRAILTAGVLWLVFFAVFALLFILPLFILPLLHPAKDFRYNLLKTFLISTAVICVFCWIQCLLDVLGVARERTLLCLGCTHRTFGFPHPSGFAIEPQFMGNLLLAPTLTVLYLLVFRPAHARTAPRQPKRYALWALAALYSATLFLTMSRGAIYAYAVALVALLGYAVWQRYRARRPRYMIVKWQNLLIIPVATFIITLFAQGTFSAVSPTASTFSGGIAKVVHQLSLGIIDLRSLAAAPDATPAPAAPNEADSSASSTASELSSAHPAPAFDGYVAASTNVRLGLSRVALQTWLYDPNSSHNIWLAPPFCQSDPCTASYGFTPLRMLFGVGIGGAGVAMEAAFPDDPLIAPDNIVQNEFISLLLETGLVGWGLIILGVYLAFRPRSEFWQHPALPLLVALIIAYLITLNFFSGFANALQIYLVPPLLYYVFGKTAAPRQKSLVIPQNT